MDNRQIACNRYIKEFHCFAQAASKMELVLLDICKMAGLRHSSIEVRPKEVSSFIKKMHSRAYNNPWVETTDKVGGRIITETLVDRESIRAHFEQRPENILLKVLAVEDKSDLVGPSELYYPGIHIQVIVPEVTTSDGADIECEIQLRTKAQDAWASVTHGSLYKKVIKPTKQTERRLFRLSVLSEMFDDEVKTAMSEIKSDPAYEKALLLRAIENIFLPIAGVPGEDQLSLNVLAHLQALLEYSSSEEYVSELGEFVLQNSKKITRIVETYGPRSEFANEWSYWLFGQPEILVIFKLISSSPMALSQAIIGSDMEEAVKHVFQSWGTEMPDLLG